jgi:aminoglycoside phosphotransferase (APT) family kinase protein
MSDLDTKSLERYLAVHVPSLPKPLAVERMSGGQSNPTYRLMGRDGRAHVLRKKPAGHLLPSAHAVEREYKVISALWNSGVPVAQAIHLCDDSTVIGTPFYVMGYVEGRVLWDPTLPELSPIDRRALYDDINRVIARLHSLDPTALGMADFGRPGNYLERQIARWSRQYRTAETQTQAAMDRLIEWLPRHVPESAAVALVHGDLRIDNMLIHPSQPRVLAVVDWELSTVGDPLADLNYHMLTWLLTADQFRGMAQADLTGLGIPGADQYLARYVERSGRAAPSSSTWEYYTVYNLFRLAAILQGIAKRAEMGTAANANAHETGAKARQVGEMAWCRAREKLNAK